MSVKFRFEKPNKAMLQQKFELLMTYHASYDRELADKFLDDVVAKGISFRPFTAHVIRHLFFDDAIKRMMEHFDQMVVDEQIQPAMPAPVGDPGMMMMMPGMPRGMMGGGMRGRRMFSGNAGMGMGM
eukprot:TRINITY_DN7680_c0_g1_i1.p4 TRINITY_DN7680_c0_g1~~TRINITY_DN7680_c0_g1_i1.p4  ORF type:complete len:127 (+),score=25.28 TRINITY_DN7680_c0_g1_i1:951-1331(+)